MAPPIECDCTTTTVTVNGDPYSGITTVTTSSTSHVVNARTVFIIGLELPDGTPADCSEPVQTSGKSYLTDTIDLATSIDLPGIGSSIDINRIYIGLDGGYTVYNRGDQWQSCCDGAEFDINPRTSIAPC